MEKFTGHSKRVTLNLTLHSAAAAQREGLLDALQEAKNLDWELDRLPQEKVEIIYSNIDDQFEAQVLAEFQADPSYLIDLKGPTGVCPLCGHVGCRWIFRLDNLKGGKGVECGSECIITYGISVKGAETAEHARQVLEGQIRKAIRKLLIEEWHKETGFIPEWFSRLRTALKLLSRDCEYEYRLRHLARVWLYEVGKLQRFYERTGWLNTKIRWEALRGAVAFVDQYGRADIKVGPLAPFKPKKEKVAEGAIPTVIEEVLTVGE